MRFLFATGSDAVGDLLSILGVIPALCINGVDAVVLKAAQNDLK